MIASLLTTMALSLGLLQGGGSCPLPEREACVEALSQVETLVPVSCVPGSLSYNEGASGEYLHGGPDPEAFIYYTPVQATEDWATLVPFHRTVIAHEVGHAWWMDHATDDQRAGLVAVMGWEAFDEEAAATIFSMAVTSEWRDYWGGWAALHPGVPEPTADQLHRIVALGLVPEVGSPFISFAASVAA